MEDIQIHYTRPLTLTELVGVGEAILKELHNGNDPRSGSLVALDWSTGLPQVAEGDTHTATDTRQLQSGVDRATDGIHIVRHLEEEAGNQLTATGTASIQETWGCRLVAQVNHFIGQIQSQLLIAFCKIEGIKEDTVFHAFQVISTVIGFEGILLVELIGSHEGLELEVLVFQELSQFLNKLWAILLQKLFFDVVFFY